MRVKIFMLTVLIIMGCIYRAQAATWTGAGANSNWDNTDNWQAGALPGVGDDAVFGAGAGSYVVHVNGDYSLDRIIVQDSPEGYVFTADPDGILRMHHYDSGVPLGHLVWVTSDVTNDVVISADVQSATANRQRAILNQSTSADLIFTGAIDANSNVLQFHGPGKIITADLQNAGDQSYFYDSVTVLFGTGTGNITRRLYAHFGQPTILLQRDVRWGQHGSNRGSPLSLGLVDSGAADRIMRIPRMTWATGWIAFLENDALSAGRFILNLFGSGTSVDVGGVNNCHMDTRANTWIHLSPAVSAEMSYASGSGMYLTGEGNLWKSNAGVLDVRTTNSYAGRTMIEEGMVRLAEQTLGETTYQGQLPESTSPEIAVGAVFDLNGIDQTLGGLLGYTGLDQDQPASAGYVELGGATLTIAAATPTAFGGTITGTGGLIKTGPETFTLSDGYTNIAGRTLGVEQGNLNVGGIMDIETGELELAGGRVTAAELAAAGGSWSVKMDAGYEDEILVDVTAGADIAGAVLNLSLAEGYTPEIGKTFTLLRADIINTGVPARSLFQFTEGRAFELDDVWFRISRTTGSESVVLTVIPELARGTVLIVR